MTREEAIWYLTPIAESASLERYKEALGLALSALREQEERDNRLESDAVKNDPLTLDELRKMDGEPVWVKLFDTGEEFWVLRYEWADTRNPEPMILFHMRWYAQADYGRTWIAYRCKPKEENKDA